MCGEDCCKKCCYSTPPATLVIVGCCIVGLMGFLVSCAYGLSKMADAGPFLMNGTMVIGPVVGCVLFITLFPLVLAVLMAYCITGYIRDVLFSSAVKTCIKPCFNYSLIAVSFISFILWLLVSIGLAAIMATYLGANHSCSKAGGGSGDGCLSLLDTDLQYLSVCGKELQSLCDNGLLDAGMGFSVALLFSAIVTVAFTLLLVIQAMNLVSARDNLEIREAQNPQNTFLLECKQ